MSVLISPLPPRLAFYTNKKKEKLLSSFPTLLVILSTFPIPTNDVRSSSLSFYFILSGRFRSETPSQIVSTESFYSKKKTSFHTLKSPKKRGERVQKTRRIIILPRFITGWVGDFFLLPFYCKLNCKKGLRLNCKNVSHLQVIPTGNPNQLWITSRSSSFQPSSINYLPTATAKAKHTAHVEKEASVIIKMCRFLTPRDYFVTFFDDTHPFFHILRCKDHDEWAKKGDQEQCDYRYLEADHSRWHFRGHLGLGGMGAGPAGEGALNGSSMR